MENKVCPYPGLRPFTEKESIFFKGREVHIRQIIRQLEEKKFVMITGASGDGKSSLVYAGVIPNARAGFFRAKFSNWLITDFRPERSPLQNLATTISLYLELDYDYVEEELSYGFSALVSLYKDSKFYIDYNSPKWLNASPTEQKELKRNASNLFILADQFEEFFTNTENFNNNKPSANAYTTINLLLETARISAAEDLPIYIVFTMRSDYISQSVAFKGLPEFIGFSQFFVPRLKRNELQQIIEEPALLSGGSVSKSLSEKLINDLPNGFDQLPLLQHIMNRLWKVADNGNEDLGLLHLAKIAGMPGKMLKAQERELFYDWQLSLESFKQVYYDKPILTNVLNTHANILYETAFDYFSTKIDWIKQTITPEEAKFILKVAFKSLTKIDQGRAVRNRMTLKEITQIVNKPHISYETVCGVLNIFRLPDSTFVHPFINVNDVATQYLAADDTFDITHEALIRNWDILQEWEAEELDNLSNLKDFQIQLNRWKENDKSSHFLLTAGTLSYFQDWYNKSEPNKYWIAKYDATSLKKGKKLEKADVLHTEIVEFLKASDDYLLAQKRKQKKIRTILFIGAAAIIFILSGVVFMANKARQFAQEQTAQIEKEKETADKQREIAEQEKDKASKALVLADEQRKIAERNAYQAQVAKLLSDSATTEAQKMRDLAELSSEYAKKEAENAKKERAKSDELRLLSDKERNKAEAERVRANKLSYLAMAQSLALRSKQNHNDPQINLLLAYKAYEFNKDNGGPLEDPEIFKALNFALLNSGKKNELKIKTQKFTAINLNSKTISLITKEGDLKKYNLDGASLESKSIYNKNSLNQNQIPVNASYFVDDKFVVLGLEDKSVLLWNIQEAKTTQLNSYKDYIRGVLKLPNNQIAIVDRSPAVKIWDLNSNLKKAVSEIKFDSRINEFCYVKSENAIFAACNNGELIAVNLKDYSKKVFGTHNSRATNIRLSPNGKLMAVGYSTGEISIYSIGDKLNKPTSVYVSMSGITDLVFNENSNLLAVASNDKRINLFNINDLEKSSITISDHEQNIKQLFIQKEKLYALCYDNSVHFWELSINAYANLVKNEINRELTKEEWNKFIGPDIK